MCRCTERKRRVKNDRSVVEAFSTLPSLAVNILWLPASPVLPQRIDRYLEFMWLNKGLHFSDGRTETRLKSTKGYLGTVALGGKDESLPPA